MNEYEKFSIKERLYFIEKSVEQVEGCLYEIMNHYDIEEIKEELAAIDEANKSLAIAIVNIASKMQEIDDKDNSKAEEETIT